MIEIIVKIYLPELHLLIVYETDPVLEYALGKLGFLGSISPTFYEQLLRVQIPKAQ